jgi:predicted transcriptional regulator
MEVEVLMSWGFPREVAEELVMLADVKLIEEVEDVAYYSMDE